VDGQEPDAARYHAFFRLVKGLKVLLGSGLKDENSRYHPEDEYSTEIRGKVLFQRMYAMRETCPAHFRSILYKKVWVC